MPECPLCGVRKPTKSLLADHDCEGKGDGKDEPAEPAETEESK